MCANGSAERSHVPKKEALIPTEATESMIVTSYMDTKQERYTMPMDTPNAFAFAEVP